MTPAKMASGIVKTHKKGTTSPWTGLMSAMVTVYSALCPLVVLGEWKLMRTGELAHHMIESARYFLTQYGNVLRGTAGKHCAVGSIVL